MFSSVVHRIIGQQISVRAQVTVWQRMQDTLGEVNADTILPAGVPKLQEQGMTFRKAEYIADYAEKVHTGTFDPGAVEHMSDEDAIRDLSALQGIGVWTAEMICCFVRNVPLFSVTMILPFSAGYVWFTTTGKSTASCLKNTAAVSAFIVAWQACTSGRWQAEQYRR